MLCKAGIRDFKAKWGRDLRLKVCTGCRIPSPIMALDDTKNNHREHGMEENLGRDDEEPTLIGKCMSR